MRYIAVRHRAANKSAKNGLSRAGRLSSERTIEILLARAPSRLPARSSHAARSSSMSASIRVFISYSHDSPEHARRVLAFSELLREGGIDAQVDQYVNGTPAGGWARWMMDQLDAAKFVLLVCTETYYRRFRGHAQPGKGKGVDWEGALITQEIYDARSRTVRFVPVLFNPANEEYIPEPLRAGTHYTLDSEDNYKRLYDFLLGQAGVEPGALGDLRRRERDRGEPLTFPPDGARGDEWKGQAGAPAFQSRIAPTRLRHSAEKLIGREADLARLDEAWANPATHVLTIVAFGGVGKTSLVAHWQAMLAARDFDGADYFDWSFYSQGTREQGGASADQFINRALEFFGDREMAGSAASPWDKGARLAELVARRRTLLVLDGLEPLQYPPGPLAGDLRDPAVAALLKGLAQRNPGLCVVTTRERVSDLAAFQPSTAPELPLHRLSTPAGVDLLQNLGVQGNERELKALVMDAHGHALTLNLLGRYLVRAHDGDIRRRDRLRFEKADASVQGGHAFKAMAAYERWLAEGGEEGARQLAILRLMGLFDRPADARCLDALRQPLAIPGLTEPIVGLAEDDWNLAVAELRDCGLVSVPEATSSGAIDAHPLIREYFAKRLRDHAPDAWREAHSRLYEHLRDSVEHQPDTLDRLQPLYQAVVHGCNAGRHQETCNSIYQDRIQRGNKFYSLYLLGAFGTDLGAVACFFDKPWTTVSPLLSANEQAWLLSVASFNLRALGRLAEARQPMRAALAMRIDQEAWKNAAISAANLSELDLLWGDTSSAVVDAEQAVIHADHSGDSYQRIVRLTDLANALYQAGHCDEAEALFQKAEEMQAEHQPEFPLIYSLQGYQYCDLLLRQPERTAWRALIGSSFISGLDHFATTSLCLDVENRALQTLGWAEDSRSSILSIAVGNLAVGRALLYRSILEARTPHPQSNTGAETLLNSARGRLDTAVEGLRRAGTIHNLPLGLLSRAWLRSVQGDAGGARTDLNEAWEIAERGPMRLFLADIHLYRARLFHAVPSYPWESPKADLAAARALIEECGYWRRKEELEDAEAASVHW